MKKDEESSSGVMKKNNANDKILEDLDEYYSKYLIDDIDFLDPSSIDEDIDTKMNKMIEKMKTGGNITYKNENKDNDIMRVESNDKKEVNKEEKRNETNETNEANNISSDNNKKNKKILNERNNKILSKQKKLELLKRKEEQYLEMIKFQKEKQIKYLENKINKLKDKGSNIIKTKLPSEMDSKNSFSLEPNIRIENGLAFLCHLFENHIILNKLEFYHLLINFVLKKKKHNVEFKLDKQRTFTNQNEIIINKSNLRRRQSVIISKGKNQNLLQDNKINFQDQKKKEEKLSYH
jgi:hypothetical protein